MNRSILLLSALAVISCDQDLTPATEEELHVAGTWQFVVDVTVSSGPCAGEKDGPVSTHTITIATGNGNQVTAKGFLGSTNQLVGTLSNSGIMILTGGYPKDGGTRYSVFQLDITSPGHMSGTEDWGWNGPTAECSGGKSNVTATKN